MTLEAQQPMQTIVVNLGSNSYPIWIGDGLLDHLGEKISQIARGQKVFVLTDRHVDGFYGAWAERQLQSTGFQVRRLVLEPGEASKSLGNLLPIYQELLDFHCSRQDLLLTLGGGVIGDLGGFVAATYLRGIDFVQVPTSLLAQVDSSVGGKVAVDLPQGKNLIGSFYQPKAVLIDPQILQTLPERYFRDGMGEVIKYGCIQDRTFFDRLARLEDRSALLGAMTEIIGTCCHIKKTLVEADEKDQGSRLLLNFGHTLGHAIETCQHYRGHSHGQAVAVGMQVITEISQSLGLTAPGTGAQLRQVLQQYELPYQLPPLESGALLAVMGLDKKHWGQKLQVVLLKKIGESFLYSTTVDFFAGALQAGKGE